MTSEQKHQDSPQSGLGTLGKKLEAIGRGLQALGRELADEDELHVKVIRFGSERGR